MSNSSETGGTRAEIQRIATHILSRARLAADGEISLRVDLSGIATPALGKGGGVLRLAGSVLVQELATPDGLRARALEVPGRSLSELAGFAGVDLDTEAHFGRDAPPVGDRDRPIVYREHEAVALFEWYRLGASALDVLLGETRAPSPPQLWPEHFDVAIDADTSSGRVNLGAAPADSTSPEPYLYVGPHTSARPGDPDFWNAPFGATLARERVLAEPDPPAAALRFFRYGLSLL